MQESGISPLPHRAPSAGGRRIRYAHDAVVEKVTITVHVVHHHSGIRVRHCRCTAAAAAAAVGIAVVAVGKWKTTCKVLLSVLSVFPCSRFSLSPPASFPVSRTSCAALVAARHTLRRSRAVRRCGPLLTRTHHALCHHVMCLFDTWLSSCSEFESSPCSSWAFTSPSCSSWASTSLSCPPWTSTSFSCSVRSF